MAAIATGFGLWPPLVQLYFSDAHFFRCYPLCSCGAQRSSSLPNFSFGAHSHPHVLPPLPPPTPTRMTKIIVIFFDESQSYVYVCWFLGPFLCLTMCLYVRLVSGALAAIGRIHSRFLLVEVLRGFSDTWSKHGCHGLISRALKVFLPKPPVIILGAHCIAYAALKRR